MLAEVARADRSRPSRCLLFCDSKLCRQRGSGPAGVVTAAENSFNPALPGQVGVRNFVRGDGFFGVDLGLSKRWKMPWNEKENLALRWEVFNVTNSTGFDFNDLNSSSASESNNSIATTTFGNYAHLMTNPRVMQFALRYEF